MSLKSILSFTFHYWKFFSKEKLLTAFVSLREECLSLANKNNELEEEINRLKAADSKRQIQAL